MDHFSLVIPFPMWLAHILRGVCILIGPFCIILSERLSRQPNMPPIRKWLFAGLSLLLAASVYTEIDRWNASVTPRLFINVAGIFVSFIGLWKMRALRGKVS